jgi:hypothetical protein
MLLSEIICGAHRWWWLATVSRPVHLGIGYPFGAHDQILTFFHKTFTLLLFLQGVKKETKKLDGGQLLLTVTEKRQIRPLVREDAQQRKDSKIQTELISGLKSQSGLDTKTY